MTAQGWTVVVGLAMVAGLVGTVVPVFPDLGLIWLAGLAYGLLVGWGEVGPWVLGLMAFVLIVGSAVELGLMGLGARLGGGSWVAIGLGLSAGLLALLVAGPLAGLIVLPIGVFVVEWRRRREAGGAGRAVLGAAVGYGLSFAVRLASALLMVLMWGVWAANMLSASD